MHLPPMPPALHEWVLTVEPTEPTWETFLLQLLVYGGVSGVGANNSTFVWSSPHKAAGKRWDHRENDGGHWRRWGNVVI